MKEFPPPMQDLPSSSSSDQLCHKQEFLASAFPGRRDARVPDAAAARRLADGATLRHDARHLLGALRTYSELMSAPGVLSDEYRHLAQELQVLSDRSAAMLGRLVTLGTEWSSASEAAGTEATVLPEVVLSCLGLLSKVAGRAVTFFCSPSAYLPVVASRLAVERILVNLVKNAAEAGQGVGTVAVTVVGMREAGIDGGVVQVVLTVQGRGTASRRRSAGSAEGTNSRNGVGFQVVRELAESSGARVESESELDPGTSVSVRWPVMDPRRERRSGTVAEQFAAERFAMAALPGPMPERLLVGGEAC